ncbi:unnamed protein product [Ceratitis capitata]|uniref:(Mediterranean fruit fly) hypothetical protein n=1 Tax=Ceratitis capitata TaxID=7213 RepID=A0A811VEA9_CERCA|nr:unnamed protein product [Ceratitis capitata]
MYIFATHAYSVGQCLKGSQLPHLGQPKLSTPAGTADAAKTHKSNCNKYLEGNRHPSFSV